MIYYNHTKGKEIKMTLNAAIEKVYYLINRYFNWEQGDYYSKEHYASQLWCVENYLEYRYNFSKHDIKQLESAAWAEAYLKALA